MAGDVGAACRALNNSDGYFAQSMQNKGRVGASAVDGRDGVVAYLDMRMQRNMGDALHAEADTDVPTLANQIVASRPDFDLAVKILGSEKPQRSVAAGRVVVTPGRFGSVTGARSQSEPWRALAASRAGRATTQTHPHPPQHTTPAWWWECRGTLRDFAQVRRSCHVVPPAAPPWGGSVKGVWMGCASDTQVHPPYYFRMWLCVYKTSVCGK